MQDEPHTVADSLRTNGAIARKGEAIIRAAICADEKAVAIVTFAQAGLSCDLSVVIGEQRVTAQAGHIDLALHGEG
ncbi:MAG: hypothetical protein RIR73_1516 [Chloroflexota bacterium]